MNKFRLQRRLIEPRIQFVGEKFVETPSIQLFQYSESDLEEISSEGDLGKIFDTISHKKNTTIWINIHGIHNITLINEIASFFDLDKLVVQDIVDTTQRPKIDVNPNFLFFSVKSLLPADNKTIESEQISFILKDNVILSFQEKKGDHFEHIRTRLRENKGIARKKSADFLIYLLLDAITGNSFATLTRLESRLEALTKDIMANSRPETITSLEEIKRDLFSIRKSAFPLKEAIIFTGKGQTQHVQDTTLPYFSDLQDQLLQLIDETDFNMTRAEGATNMFFSYQGHRMNEVMKVLTIVATIFIPLTFIAGIYGMNFENMPELSWKHGYLAILCIMALVGMGMLLYFRRKKWF
jgi:magnesium transporter